MMKRQRGRGRKPGGGGHQPNRTLESTGPDVKIRGSAAHIYDKYMQLSRDASSAGDRVASESYLQHAEHYYRMLRAMQPQQMPVLDQRFNQDFDYEDEGGGETEEMADGAEAQEGAEAEAGEQAYAQREPRQERQGERPPRQPYRDQQQQGYGGQPRSEGGFTEEGGEQEGFRGGRRRRNRGRYRPDGEGGGRGGDRGPGGPEGGGDQGSGPVEGFGESVPAFVGGD